MASGCLGTAAAGVLLDAVRRGSGSLLAPAVLHLSVNALGLLAAATAHRLGERKAQPSIGRPV